MNNALIRKEETYEIDFDDLEAKARDPRNKILIFCNPHNPVGKVWSREDLERLVEICAANHVFIIDDEIHNDLVMPGHRHTALPTVSAEASRICAYCTAPSKTFNLAGMQLSNIFIEDPEVRGRLSLSKLMGMSLSQVAISYEACRLAYEKGEPWLEELLQVVDGNAKYVASFLAEHIPQARCYPLEGTYLLWVDFGGLGLHHKELERLMLSAKLFLDEGAMFGKEGRGFERFNLALPRSAVESAMARLLKAWQDLQADWAANGRPERLTLEAGMKMPDFTYDTPFTSGLRFVEECGGRPVVLLFHRYYSCSVCNAAMDRLAADYDAVTAAGGQVKVVLQSAPERVREAMGGENRFPFDVVCDPERTLYERFSVFPADTMFDLAGDDLQALLPMAAGMFFGSGREDAPHEGLQDQLPAWFAVDGDGVVRRAHYGESIFDVPDAAAMAEAMRGMGG